MKYAVVVRKLDNVGRITLPFELRRMLNIKYQDEMEIFTELDSVILEKRQPMCLFCGNKKEVKHFNGKYICKECINLMTE